MKIELHRGFQVTGCEITDFLDAVKSMEAITRCVPVHSTMLGLAGVVNSTQDSFEIAVVNSNNKKSISESTNDILAIINRYAEANKLTLYWCEPGGKFSLRALGLDAYSTKPGVTDALVNELRLGSKMLMTVPDGGKAPKTCVVSDLAFSTLNNRARIGGDAMSGPSIGRVVQLAKAFHYFTPQDLTLIIRSNDAANVVIAAHSGKYAYVPQTILCDLYDKIALNFGEPKCLSWSVTHELSDVYLGFPSIEKDFSDTYKLPTAVTPGLYLSTSDSGDGSLTIKGIWDINGHRAGGPVVKRNHRGDIDLDAFIENARKTIFAKFATVPERLAELLTIDVKEPEKMLRSVFAQIGIAKSANLGRKTSSLLFAQLVNELDPKAKYTAYDIAMMLASVPDRCIGMHHSVISKMEDLFMSAIFADYSGKKDVKDGGELFLA